MTQVGTKKSRRGCKRCKTRRVKCDEQTPCNNCVRRNEECSLLEPSPSSSVRRISESTRRLVLHPWKITKELTLEDQETPLDPALPNSPDEWCEDLALMHHYTRNTILMGPLGDRARVHALWRDYIPQQATQHKFLMHGLLALSALHLASLHPDQAHKYVRLCDKHQTLALAKYRSILASEVDPNSADALFAFAATLSVSAMARSCSPGFMSQAETIDIDAVVELFYLTRGVRDVIDLCDPHIRSGPMSQLFHGHRFEDDTVVALPPPVAAHLRGLCEEMLPAAQLDPEALEHCRIALTELEDIYKNIVYFSSAHGDPGLESGQIWRWCVAISTGFLRLIQARIPAALIILAHFAAATNAVRTSWYTEKWGTYTLNGIQLELDPQYRDWIQWPLLHGAHNMAVMGVKQPEDDGRRPLIGF